MQQTFDTWVAPEESQEQQLSRMVSVLQALTGGPKGYRLRRILLTNFWLYGEQVFELPHGRLFLAGENASGKSTVLTAALPLALDGDLRPNRIDTFGGRERHIDYYVLGGNESATPFHYERRTAYIALEFEWCNTDAPPLAQEIRQRWENADEEQRAKLRYLTIGLSLAGNANVSDRIRPLRFLITDGSRLGYDLHTVFESGNRHEKRAYDHSRFKQLLEGHGLICETQAEYERQVSRYLFGFADVKDFQKLINLLLVLRRPNLSTELNFSRVHEYLKQSLRRIPSETTQRVIGTIERIDSIQSEIEHLQESFDATARLHQAVQRLALASTQLAANEYVDAYRSEETIQNRVTRLNREVKNAEDERQRANAKTQEIQTQLTQISGQIRVLESSEGLQVAKQLATARERMMETESQARLQEQSLKAARQTTRTASNNLENRRQSFARTRSDIVALLDELKIVATGTCLWELAAFQLEEATRSIATLTPEDIGSLQMPGGVSMLTGEQPRERIDWLRHLSELHRQREQADQRVQHARSLETTRFQELDEVRRRFQSIREHIQDARQKLNKTLEQWLLSSEIDLSSEDISSITSVDTLFVEDGQENEAYTTSIVTHVQNTLLEYRGIIQRIERELVDAADQVQGELNELQLVTGSKNHERSELEAAYERILAEPEYVPPRSPRRTLARAKLAEQGIVAYPLYTLVDFVPDIAEEEAGRIEYILEDAGLLDALVIAPSQSTTAETILAANGLSDCRLNIERIEQNAQSHGEGLQHWLRYDVALNETLDEQSAPQWEAITATLLATLGQPQAATEANLRLHEDGMWTTWTHGLLTGRASRGVATCIGKATRLRVRQRELDTLNEQRQSLDEELHWLHQRLADYEQQIAMLQARQAEVRQLLPESRLDERYAEIVQAKQVLDDGNVKYQKARLQTQERRQEYNRVLVQLESESQGISALAASTKQVQDALEGTMTLQTQAKSLQLQVRTLSRIREDYQGEKVAVEQAQDNEVTVATLYDRVHQQALQAQAEFQELQHVAENTQVEELEQRLSNLRQQNDTLSQQLDTSKSQGIRADERANNARSQLEEQEEQLHIAHAENGERQMRFTHQLSAYPVEQLLAVQKMLANDAIHAARMVVAELEGDTLTRRERLETGYRDAYSALSKTFNHEQPYLLEYGPNLDEQGNIQFLNENKSRPVELLEVFGERIEMQRTLLGQEERQLFEDFLLQEIAEAIRVHILEAEEWVQQINTVLGGLPMIGEHYSLQWKALNEYDPAMLGSHLAEQYRLLRKPAQALTPEEGETLMNAFRQEIESVRLRQQEMPEMNFMDALEQVFDYREWFHFDVWVTPVGGQRQRMTDRIAGTRSGAEQLFALYVPLFAALGALYRTAAPGAPRLLALDEAFDKVSLVNTQRMMEFLVSQDFQWIMTGPQVSGTGAKIPASARYLMLHEKGSSLATASASFWSDSLDIEDTEDEQNGREQEE